MLAGQRAAAEERMRAERAPLPAPPLGNIADFAPPAVVESEGLLPPPVTVRAWYLRSCARDILTKADVRTKTGSAVRMRSCGKRIRRGLDGVGVYARPDRAYGRISGVCVCGQSIACPVCAPRIAAFRAAEIADGYARAKAVGLEARLETFTIPHTAGSSLGEEIDVFAEAWRLFGKGKCKDELRAVGHQVGREVTWTLQNGWHYHHHRGRYDRIGTYDSDRNKFYWLAALRAVGRLKRGAEEHAFHVREIGDIEDPDYIADDCLPDELEARKFGSELASAATKSKNLATLLLAATMGEEVARQAWLEGVTCIVRRKVSSVRWSRGFKAFLGMAPEKSDEEVAQEEVVPSDIFLGSLTAMQWRGIVLQRAEFALVCAANAGRDAVNNFLSGLELGQLDDEACPAVVVPLQDDNVYRGWSPVVG